MKIKDILQEKLIYTKTKEIPVKNLSSFATAPTDKQGHYSTVSDTKDPHLKTKTAKNWIKASRDPYWDYAELCMKHQDDNPYFPRIYSYKKYKDAEGRIIPRVQMETLHKIKDVSIEAVKGYFSSLFHDLDYIEYESEKSFIYSAIAGRLQDVYYGETAGVNDEKLIECLQIIKQFVKDANEIREKNGEHKILLDLHSDNYMIRMGSNGIHLVITDPLAGKVVW